MGIWQVQISFHDIAFRNVKVRVSGLIFPRFFRSSWASKAQKRKQRDRIEKFMNLFPYLSLRQRQSCNDKGRLNVKNFYVFLLRKILLNDKNE